MAVLQLTALIILANSAPLVARHVLTDLWQQPVDGGLVLRDGRRLFGRSKTWRGLVCASLVCALTAPLVGLAWNVGLVVGAAAMGGDLLASFIKRRLDLDAGQRAPRLDSIPEALLPALLLRESLELSWLDVVLVVVVFMLAVRLASPLFYRLRLRSRPW